MQKNNLLAAFTVILLAGSISCFAADARKKIQVYQGSVALGQAMIKVGSQCIFLTASLKDEVFNSLTRTATVSGFAFRQRGKAVLFFPERMTIYLEGSGAAIGAAARDAGCSNTNREIDSSLMKAIRLRVRWLQTENPQWIPVVYDISPPMPWVDKPCWTYSFAISSKGIPIGTPLEIEFSLPERKIVTKITGSLVHDPQMMAPVCISAQDSSLPATVTR